MRACTRGPNPKGWGTCRNFGQNSRSLGHFVRHPLFWPKLTVTLRGPQCPAGIWVPTRGTHVVPRRGTTFKNLSPIYWPRLAPTFRGRTMCSHRPHFVGLNGHPIGHPYGYPIGHPFLGSTSLNYCPFGAGMQACSAHLFRSVPLRYFFSLRAPSGPLMGTLWAPMWAPYGAPTFKKFS